jgi:hypothetical protein
MNLLAIKGKPVKSTNTPSRRNSSKATIRASLMRKNGTLRTHFCLTGGSLLM